jgi:hypothetical protein
LYVHICASYRLLRPAVRRKAFRWPPEIAFAEPERALEATIVFGAKESHHPLEICALEAS